MKILLIVLVLVLVVMISGGLWFYFNVFKKMAKEFKEFVQVTFEALKDRKLTIAEKEKMLKEWADLKPITKSLKDKFVEDVKDLGEDIKELYEKIKDKVKKK
jgi:peptidoglycan hydrolase CwlO-like protein